MAHFTDSELEKVDSDLSASAPYLAAPVVARMRRLIEDVREARRQRDRALELQTNSEQVADKRRLELEKASEAVARLGAAVERLSGLSSGAPLVERTIDARVGGFDANGSPVCSTCDGDGIERTGHDGHWPCQGCAP